MQNNKKKSKKKAPILCAIVIIGLLGVYLATVLYAAIGASCGEEMAGWALLIYGVIIVAVIVGILVALRQRLKEIESGEEEDAAQY